MPAAGPAARGAEMKLTPMEYKLLCLLAKNTGKVLTHNYIISEIWGVSAGERGWRIPLTGVYGHPAQECWSWTPAIPNTSRPTWGWVTG